jgi:hypothetical protein
MVLGVPEQNAPIPQELLDYAAERGVKIKPLTPPATGGKP